jgi:hypothetical protein
MTGYDGRDEIQRAREVGFDHYVRKPVHAEVFEALCARLLPGLAKAGDSEGDTHGRFVLAAAR